MVWASASSQALTRANIGARLWPRTAGEIAAGVTPTLFHLAPGDVMRYGAVGDEVTDDTAAIQDAIDSNPTIFFPNGIYTVANLIYKSNFSMYAQSPAAILKLIDNATTASHNGGIIDSGGVYPGNILASTLDDQGGANFDNGVRAIDENNSTYIFENVIIDGLTFDGNKANNQVGDTGENASAMGAGVSINQCNNVTVRNCLFKDHRLEGVFIGYSLHGGSDHCTVENCHFTGNQRSNVVLTTGKYNSVLNNTGTAPTGGTGVTAGAALDIEANLVDEVNYRHSIVGNRLGGRVDISSPNKVKQWGTTLTGNVWLGRISIMGQGSTQGVVVDGDTFVADDSTEFWINRTGPNVAATDEIPAIIRNCTATGFEGVLKTQAAGGVENLSVEGCTFHGETFGEISRGYRIAFRKNHFYLTGNTDLHTIKFSNTLGGTVTNQGQIVFDDNTFHGVSNATTFDFSRNTTWPVGFEDFIFSNNKVLLTGATNSFDLLASVTLKDNFITNFKPILAISLDKTRILGNIVSAAAAEDLFSGQTAVFNDNDISRNQLQNISVNVDRPKDSRINGNTIVDGTIDLAYSFTSAGIGRNSVCGNTLTNTGALTSPFNVTTGASFLIGDFVANDQYRNNTFVGFSAQPSIAAGVVAAIDGTFPTVGYAPTNVTEDRAFDADTVTTPELADIVGTLISDLGMQ